MSGSRKSAPNQLPFLLLAYFVVYLAFVSLTLLVPTRYVAGSYFQSSALMAAFFVLSFLLGLVTYMGLKVLWPDTSGGSAVQRSTFGEATQAWVLVLPVFIAILATAFLFFDRMVIQGIDYSKGIAHAREAWRAAGEGRTGISSIYSVIGNLFSSFYFVTLVLLFTEWEMQRKRLKWPLALIILVMIGGNTFLLGGRSLLMLVATTLVGLMMVRKSRGLPLLPFKLTLTTKLLSISVAAAVLVYGIYVFHLRAQQNDITASQYLDSMSAHLSGRVVDGYFCHETDGPVCNALNYSALAGSYITHSAWTFQAVLDMDQRPGKVLFNFYRTNLARILGQRSDFDQWLHAGLFISLPGALFYDFGLLGLALGAVVLGISLGIAQRLSEGKRGLLGLSFVLGVIYIAFLFPLVPAMDIMNFPFIMFAFGTMWFAQSIVKGMSRLIFLENERIRQEIKL